MRFGFGFWKEFRSKTKGRRQKHAPNEMNFLCTTGSFSFSTDCFLTCVRNHTTDRREKKAEPVHLLAHVLLLLSVCCFKLFTISVSKRRSGGEEGEKEEEERSGLYKVVHELSWCYLVIKAHFHFCNTDFSQHVLCLPACLLHFLLIICLSWTCVCVMNRVKDSVD